MRDDRPPPPTLGQITEHATGVFFWCNGCHHNAVVPLNSLIAQLGPDLPFAAVHGRLRCQACGSKDIHARPDWPSLGQVTSRFHTINRKTGTRIRSQYVDAVSGKPVDEHDEVKGQPRGEDDFILIEDEELEAVGLESVRTIDIDVFVPAESIDWIWQEKPYYLMPDDPVGEETFAVIRDAMAATNMVGIARLVLNRRERAVLLEPRDEGIVLWTLGYGDEVRDAAGYFAKIVKTEIDAEEMRL